MIGYNGKKVSKKKIRKIVKKMKKLTMDFLMACGMSKKDIREAIESEKVTNFEDIDELEDLMKEVLGEEL